MILRRGAKRVLVGRLEEMRQLGRPRRRWEDNIKIDLQEVRWGGTDCITLAQDRDRWRALVKAVRTFGFHKIQGISWQYEVLLAFQEGLYSVELVSLAKNIKRCKKSFV